jgi:P4 family phage/plasmid primase-like protien
MQNAKEMGAHHTPPANQMHPSANGHIDFTAEQLELPSFTFMGGDGQYHTDEPGKENRKPYIPMTLADVGQMIEAPPSTDKKYGRWAIFSTLFTREFDAQLAGGEFVALWCDFDHDPRPLDEVVAAWHQIAGQSVAWFYTTRSAKVDWQKSRLIVPLAAPVDGQTFTLAQEVLNDLFERKDFKTDRNSQRAGQLCYLPNRGEFYDWRKQGGSLFDVDGLGSDLRLKQAQHTLAKHERKASRQAAAERRQARFEERQRGGVNLSPIEWFNETHSLDEILDSAGYESDPSHSDKYRHPLSESGSFSARVWREGDVERVSTLSGSDPLFLKTGEAHDAFSAWCILEHDGDDTAALQAARQLKGAETMREVVAALTNGDDDGWHVTPYGVEGLPDLSHDQLAIELSTAGFAKDARYVAQWSKWLFWNGSRWERDEKLKHATAVRDYLRAKATKLMEWADKKAESILAGGGDAAEKQAKAVQAYARDNAKTLRQNHCIMAIESLAKSNAELAAVASQFDSDPMVLGTPSGTVDLATGEMRPATRTDYLTRQCAVAPATPGTACPTWMAFLHRAMDGDAQKVEFLQRVVGYTLTGQTNEHKLFFLFGTGRNGKSVFVNTIFRMMGDYAKRAPAQTFLDSHGERHPTDLAGLQGARLVAGSELPAGKAWNESIIKDLTGGDIITARFMRGDFFDYRPQFTLFIAGNHQPAIKTTDEAMRARIVLVPFTVTIPEHERDPMLESKLRQEWPAILRWAVDGAVAWEQGGLRVPASVRDASREYLDMEDHIGEFIDERLRTKPGNTVQSAELYWVFSDWQKNAGITPWSKKAMSQALAERGIKSHRVTAGARVYRDLAVVPHNAADVW